MILQIIKKPNLIFVSLFIRNIFYSRHSRTSNYVKFTVFNIFLFLGKFRSLISKELSSKICLLFLPCLWQLFYFVLVKQTFFCRFLNFHQINTLSPRLINCRPFFGENLRYRLRSFYQISQTSSKFGQSLLVMKLNQPKVIRNRTLG